MAGNSSDSLRVLHVAETIQGGIATYLKNVLPRQVNRYGATNVRVVVPVNQWQELDGVDVSVLPFANGRGRLDTGLRAAWALRQQLKVWPADVVHVHSSFAGVTCRVFLGLFCKHVRIVYCPHGWAFVRGSRADGVAAVVERIMARFCNAIVCVSAHEADVARDRGIRPDKLYVIQNGVSDTESSSGSIGGMESLWPTDTLRLVFVGRMDRQKGFDVLAAALQQVERPVSLHAFGGSVRHDAKDSLAVPGCVTQHGWVTADVMAPYLATCHAVVMPSRWEGLPYTALEAMRAGKALIASEIGGLTEVVDADVTGMLVRADDSLALAHAIDQADITQLQQMGQAARERFLARFTANRMEADLAEIYEGRS